MGRSKANATAVEVDGRIYHPDFPASEQDDVAHITKKKFKGMTPAACANVTITEEELQNFIKVYPRLHQVGKRNQARFMAWKKKHEAEIRGWDIGDFFRTKEEDERDGTVLRKAGAPPEAVEEWERQRAGEAAERKKAREEKQGAHPVNHDDGDGGGDKGSDEGPKLPPTPRRSLRNAPKPSPDLSTLLGVDNDANNSQLGHSQQPDPTASMSLSIPTSSMTLAGDTIDDDLTAAAAAASDPLGTVKTVAAHLKQLSDGADARDHYKPALGFLALQLRGAVVGFVADEKKRLSAGKKRAYKDDDDDSDDDMDGDKTEEDTDSEMEEQERIRAKQERTVGEFGKQREGKAMRRK